MQVYSATAAFVAAPPDDASAVRCSAATCRSSHTALQVQPSACRIAIVMPVLSELAAREVAKLCRQQPAYCAASLQCELLGIAEAHAEHCLDLQDERWHSRVVRTASRAWRSAAAVLWHLQRQHMVRCAYLSRRVAPQLAQGPWLYCNSNRASATSNPGISRVYLNFCTESGGFTGVAPSRVVNLPPFDCFVRRVFDCSGGLYQ